MRIISASYSDNDETKKSFIEKALSPQFKILKGGLHDGITI